MNIGGLRIEKRLEQRRWLIVAVPLGSLVVAHIAIALLLLATGHPPMTTLRRLFDAAYLADGALTNTLIAATPLAFTGLAAAVAFRASTSPTIAPSYMTAMRSARVRTSSRSSLIRSTATWRAAASRR